MKLNFIGTLFLFSIYSSPSLSTEYIFRDLMADTLLSAKCELPEEAKKTAQKSYKIKLYSKKFCQTQGYGWHVEEVKNNGDVACNQCSDKSELEKCRLKDVVVTCKRIKPGTVGMLPGKG